LDHHERFDRLQSLLLLQRPSFLSRLDRLRPVCHVFFLLFLSAYKLSPVDGGLSALYVGWAIVSPKTGLPHPPAERLTAKHLAALSVARKHWQPNQKR
jgi:hypothetical protein